MNTYIIKSNKYMKRSSTTCFAQQRISISLRSVRLPDLQSSKEHTQQSNAPSDNTSHNTTPHHDPATCASQATYHNPHTADTSCGTSCPPLSPAPRNTHSSRTSGSLVSPSPTCEETRPSARGRCLLCCSPRCSRWCGWARPLSVRSHSESRSRKKRQAT
jgi:hypothetical protein